MTFQTSVYAVDGNAESGNFLRLMLQSATAGASGIVGATDCLVSATSPPTTAVSIAAGAVVIPGTEAAYQGSYYGYNVGADTTVTVPATGGSAASYMIIARAEDPTWSGTPWGGPASGQIIFPRAISCASGATTPPGGSGSCIALARVDMPSSTSTVQQSYITDLRAVSSPQRVMGMTTMAGANPATSWTVSTTAHAWPPSFSTTVPIPPWATAMTAVWIMNDVNYPAQTPAARGFVNLILGTSVTAPNLTFPQTLISIPGQTTGFRHTVGGGSKVSIGASLRGTTQTMQFAQVTDGTNTGILQSDESTNAAVFYFFEQLAAAS